MSERNRAEERNRKLKRMHDSLFFFEIKTRLQDMNKVKRQRRVGMKKEGSERKQRC